MSNPIVVVGSLNMDLVVHAPRHPQPGETLLGSGFATYPGGKGANQVVAAARLGGQTAMVGRVGQDAFGEILRGELKRAAVDDTFVQADSARATGVALITIDAAGQNTIVVASGANAGLSPQDVSRAKALFQQGGILLLQLETPLETVWAAMQLAAQRGMQILLNPAPAAVLPAELIAASDYLIPNQTELALLSGVDAVEAGVQVLHRQGARNVIVTLGAEGARYSGRDGAYQVPAFPAQVVDTTAAGDAFVGALAVALAEGKAAREAIRWGAAAGALAVSRPGAQTSLPFREELLALLAKHDQ